MTQCKNPDIAERLVAGLAPDEFPEEAALIHGHLDDCDTCRKELDALTELDRFLRTHKDILAGALSECPAPETLVDHAFGRVTSSDVRSHVEACATCEVEVFLIRDLDREAPVSGRSVPTKGEELVIGMAVARTFGPVAEAKGSFFAVATQKLRERLSFPSFAVGAVAAAVLVLALLPGGSRNGALEPHLSDVRWEGESGGLMPKSIFGAPPRPAKKTVAVILVGAPSQRVSQEQLDAVYRRMELPAQLSGSHELISPRDVRMLLGDKPAAAAPETFSQIVFDKVQTDLLLLVTLSSQEQKFSLHASLVSRGNSTPLATMSFAGVEKERLAERVSVLGRALLESQTDR